MLIAVDGTSYNPSVFKTQLVLVIIEVCVIKEPSSWIFSLPVLLKLYPSILLPIVFYQICLSHILTSNNWCFSHVIISLDVSSIQTPHLMPIQTLVELMLILNTTNTSTARTLLITNRNSNTIYKWLFIFRCKCTKLFNFFFKFCFNCLC